MREDLKEYSRDDLKKLKTIQTIQKDGMRLYKIGAVEMMWEGMEMWRGWMMGKEERSDAASPSSLFSYIFFLYSYYVVLLTPLF